MPEEVYTQYSTEDLLETTILSGLISGTALADSAPLAAIIAEKVTPDFLAEIADKHRKGRALLVGTTSLDSGHLETWGRSPPPAIRKRCTCSVRSSSHRRRSRSPSRRR